MDLPKLKSLRESLGLSVAEAAKRAGLPKRQQWYAIESGDKANIKLDTLDKIAAALGVKAKDLLK